MANRFAALEDESDGAENKQGSVRDAVSSVIESKLEKLFKPPNKPSPKHATRGKQVGGPSSPENKVNDAIQQTLAKVIPSLCEIMTDAVIAASRHLAEEARKSSDQHTKEREELNKAKTIIQTQHFELDRLEQYSRRDSVRIVGLSEASDPAQENTTQIALDLAKDLGVVLKEDDISTSHRVGAPRNLGTNRKPRPIIVKLVRRDRKTALMKSKRQMKEVPKWNKVYLEEDLTPLRARLVRELRSDGRQVWTREGRIFTKPREGGKETIQTLDTPDDFLKVGWSEERVRETGLYLEI